MTPEKWKIVKEIFGSVVELPLADRSAALRARSDIDTEIINEVFALLEADEEASDFI